MNISLGSNAIVHFFELEIRNLIGILPYILIGIVICKYKLFEIINQKNSFSQKKTDKICIFILGLLFVLFNYFHKSVLLGIVALCVFILFNLIKKSGIAKEFFTLLGTHSTNIWLSHMFFYLVLFPGLVQKVNSPILMLLFMLVLCIGTSLAEKSIEKIVRML